MDRARSSGARTSSLTFRFTPTQRAPKVQRRAPWGSSSTTRGPWLHTLLLRRFDAGIVQKEAHDNRQHRYNCAVLQQRWPSCASFPLLQSQLEEFTQAVVDTMPGLRDRIRIGADVTIRRTLGVQHGAAASYEKHNPSAVHSDSWDGTVLGFALLSTKLGTPVYPEAVFPSPIAMFLSQSRTGRNDAHQLDMKKNIGALRDWNPGTLVIMPAAVAHSKPSQEQIALDPDPSIPRWFCRATLRVAIRGRRGKTREAREERLGLAILVARHVWGDPSFASAVEALRNVPRKQWVCKVDTKRADSSLGTHGYTGQTDDDGNWHGRGRLVYSHGGYYEEWSHGKKHGKGFQVSPCGRKYSGLWNQGKKDGPGTFEFKNGTVFETSFRER